MGAKLWWDSKYQEMTKMKAILEFLLPPDHFRAIEQFINPENYRRNEQNPSAEVTGFTRPAYPPTARMLYNLQPPPPPPPPPLPSQPPPSRTPQHRLVMPRPMIKSEPPSAVPITPRIAHSPSIQRTRTYKAIASKETSSALLAVCQAASAPFAPPRSAQARESMSPRDAPPAPATISRVPTSMYTAPPLMSGISTRVATPGHQVSSFIPMPSASQIVSPHSQYALQQVSKLNSANISVTRTYTRRHKRRAASTESNQVPLNQVFKEPPAAAPASTPRSPSPPPVLTYQAARPAVEYNNPALTHVSRPEKSIASPSVSSPIASRLELQLPTLSYDNKPEQSEVLTFNLPQQAGASDQDFQLAATSQPVGAQMTQNAVYQQPDFAYPHMNLLTLANSIPLMGPLAHQPIPKPSQESSEDDILEREQPERQTALRGRRSSRRRYL